MAEVILDPTTRAPSTATAKVLRLLFAVGVAKFALWISGYGVTLDATDQLALVTICIAMTGALGTEARNRGWPILRVLLALPLVLALSGCATWCSPTPKKAWSMALTSYTAAVQTMTAYCFQPTAERAVCTAAANATVPIDLVILSTDQALQGGTIQDAQLAAATSTVNSVLPLLERAAGGK